MKGLAALFYLVGSVLTGLGFYKLIAYKYSETYTYENINAYVGGDAYNYIINAGKATAFFVIAGIFILLASSIIIIDYLMQNNKLLFLIANKDKAIETEAKETIEDHINA